MARNPDKAPTELSLLQLLPTMLTIAAICAGLSAIRSGFHGHYVLAVQLILAAAILDGLDGRVARLLGSNSKLGADLIREMGFSKTVVQAVLCHNEAHGITCETKLDKAHYCTDPLTGFINASALFRLLTASGPFLDGVATCADPHILFGRHSDLGNKFSRRMRAKNAGLAGIKPAE